MIWKLVPEMLMYLLSETEDGLPRTGYAAARDRDVGYPRDRIYEDQLGRAAWRDGDGLGGGGDLVRLIHFPDTLV